MTDIVTRLREGVFGTNETKTDAVIHSHMQVAAAEIEWLRGERDRLAAEVARAHKDALAWMEKVSSARREGIEAAYNACERRLRFHLVDDYQNRDSELRAEGVRGCQGIIGDLLALSRMEDGR